MKRLESKIIFRSESFHSSHLFCQIFLQRYTLASAFLLLSSHPMFSLKTSQSLSLSSRVPHLQTHKRSASSLLISHQTPSLSSTQKKGAMERKKRRENASALIAQSRLTVLVWKKGQGRSDIEN